MKNSALNFRTSGGSKESCPKIAIWALLLTASVAPAYARQTKTEQAPQVKEEVAKEQSAEMPAKAEESQAPKTKTDEDPKLISTPGAKALGMSILGNQEAPTALVIVPWKRSELGNTLGISTMLDDSRQPIDKEVFMRMLSYYEIRSETARSVSAPAKVDAAQSAATTNRRKQ